MRFRIYVKYLIFIFIFNPYVLDSIAAISDQSIEKISKIMDESLFNFPYLKIVLSRTNFSDKDVDDLISKNERIYLKSTFEVFMRNIKLISVDELKENVKYKLNLSNYLDLKVKIPDTTPEKINSLNVTTFENNHLNLIEFLKYFNGGISWESIELLVKKEPNIFVDLLLPLRLGLLSLKSDLNVDQLLELYLQYTDVKNICKAPWMTFHNDTNSCVCNGHGENINPFDPYGMEIKKCRISYEIKELCIGPGTRYISGKCFCYSTNQFLSSINKDYLGFPIYEEVPKDLSIKINECNQQATIYLDILSKISLLGPEIFSKPNLDQCNITLPTFHSERRPIKRTEVKARSVYIKEINKGIHGGERLTIGLLEGQKWDDRTDSPGEQGNPNFGTGAFPPSLGEFLGFNKDKKQLPIIPSREELQGGINALNKIQLSSPDSKGDIKIKVNFIQVEGELGAREYLKGIAQDFSIPMADIENYQEFKDATYFLHDINFHAAGYILVPAPFLDIVVKQILVLFKFEKFFFDKYPQLQNQYPWKLKFDRLIEQIVVRLDSASANLTQLLYELYENNDPLKLEKIDQTKLVLQLFAFIGGNGLNYYNSVEEYFNEVIKKGLNLELHRKKDQVLFENLVTEFIKYNSENDKSFKEKLNILSPLNFIENKIEYNEDKTPKIDPYFMYLERLKLLNLKAKNCLRKRCE